VAELASYIEIGKLGRPIGLQDQFAASFGGLNAIEFSAGRHGGSSARAPAPDPGSARRSLLLFYTGASRNAATILREQRASSQEQDATVIESLHGIKRDAEVAREALRAGDIRQIGQILHESWQRKKRLANGISNDGSTASTSSHSSMARAAEDCRGGRGGFLLLFCEPEHQPRSPRSSKARA
jgi:D-glycero-alpha-D-manno-heptose-7-phosphate kinase